MILLNLFVAIILQGFDKLMKHEDSPVKPFDIEMFIKIWVKFDKKGRGFIPSRKFCLFMMILPDPLGWENRKYS